MPSLDRRAAVGSAGGRPGAPRWDRSVIWASTSPCAAFMLSLQAWSLGKTASAVERYAAVAPRSSTSFWSDSNSLSAFKPSSWPCTSGAL